MAEVLQVITDQNPRGAQVFAADLERSLIQRGRSVKTVALEPGTYERLLDVPALGPSRMAPATLRPLRREMGCAGVVIAHGSTTLAASAVAGARTGTPFIYRQISDLNFWVNTAPRRLRARALLRRADAVVALHAGSAETVRGFNVDAARIRVIPNGVPAARFPLVEDKDRAAAREGFGLKADRPTAAFVAALSSEKNPLAAMRAVARLTDVQLLIVGDGPQRAEVDAEASGPYAERMCVVGPLQDVWPAYCAADVLILSSTSESMPAVLIEAAFAGVPAVATDVGAAAEVIVQGETGEVVAPGDEVALSDAINRVLQRTGEYGMQARSRCLERYEIEVVADRWQDLLDETLRNAGR